MFRLLPLILLLLSCLWPATVRGEELPVTILKRFARTGEGCYLDIFLDLENDQLNFLRQDTLYRGGYRFSSALFRQGEQLPFLQQSQEKSLFLPGYRETERRQRIRREFSRLHLAEGDYRLELLLQDLNSRRTLRAEQELTYHSRGENYGVGEPVLITVPQKFSADTLQLLSNPLQGDQLAQSALFLEIFCRTSPQSYRLNYEIFNQRGERVSSGKLEREARSLVNYEVLNLASALLKAGSYSIKVQVELGGAKFERSTDLVVAWQDNVLPTNLVEAARQMVYIVPQDSLNRLLAGPQDSLESWYTRFWQQPRARELKEEYYRRINYATSRFSSGRKPGWMSDMGQIYCVMGEPDEIQSNPYWKNERRPYELWLYYEKRASYLFELVGNEYVLRRENP